MNSNDNVKTKTPCKKVEMFSFKNSIPINMCLKAFLKSENEEFQTQFMDLLRRQQSAGMRVQAIAIIAIAIG